ncbi:MAG: zinc-binding alcohol dehydrogenase family protein [Cyclobacteriaceae bacterium]
MKYIVCENPGNFRAGEKPAPEPKKGEILVQIKYLGVCGTDLHAFSGNQAYFTYPRILGHEIAAEILDPNGHHDFIKGDKVVVIPYLHCGKCMACRVGKTNCCEQLKVLGVHTDGAMQGKMALPSSILLPTPDLEWQETATIEPLAVAAHAVQRANIKKGGKVLVMGCGPIGLALIVFARLAGAEVTALDINPWRLDLAQNDFGAKHQINANLLANDAALAKPHLNHYHTVFDATGNKKAMELGPAYMGHGGRYVLVGLYKSDLVFNHPAIHAKETAIICSRNATKKDFQMVIQTLSDKLFPTESYITHQVNFGDIISQFPNWNKPENNVVKAMITF